MAKSSKSKKNRKPVEDEIDETETSGANVDIDEDENENEDEDDEVEESVKPKKGKKSKAEASDPKVVVGQAKFKVMAIRTGFYDLGRRKAHDIDKDGNPRPFWMTLDINADNHPVRLPTWVVLLKDYIKPTDDEPSKPKGSDPSMIKL